MTEPTETVTFDVSYPIDDFPNRERLVSWLLDTAHNEEKAIQRLVYVFVSDEALLELNKQFLDHDTYTDILTFPYSYKPIEADIYISYERVVDNASEFGVDVTDELKRVIIHGLLHMCGYSDTTDADKKLMRQKEDFYLSRA